MSHMTNDPRHCRHRGKPLNMLGEDSALLTTAEDCRSREHWKKYLYALALASVLGTGHLATR